MPADARYVETGLDVVDEGGAHVGTVKHVWPEAASTGVVETPGDSLPADEPVAPEGETETSRMTARGYFQVDRGLLHLGGRLWVPYSAIYDIVPDEKIVLNCFLSEAEHLYAQRPDSIPPT